MDSSEFAMHLAKASATADAASKSVREFGAAVGQVTTNLQKKLRPFAAAHLELERRRRDSATPQD